MNKRMPSTDVCRIRHIHDQVERALLHLPEAIDYPGGSVEARLLLKLRESMRTIKAQCLQLIDGA